MNRFEEHRKNRGQRKYEFRTARANSYLIVTEGESTEPNYFNGLRSLITEKVGGNVDLINIPIIDIEGTGRSTIRLIEKVDMIVNKAKIIYQNIWVVFDKDEFIDFDEAIELGKKNGYSIAWSNQSFEYWLFLHFYYSDAALHRDEWVEKLNAIFGHLNLNNGVYSKACPNLYNIISNNGRGKTAIKNAKKRMATFNYDTDKPSEYDPGTTVYQLVEELNKYLEPS